MLPPRDFSPGGSWVIGEASFYINEVFSLEFTLDDKYIKTIDLPAAFHYDIEKDIASVEYTQPAFSVINIAYNGNGLYLILTTKGLCAVAKNGEIKWTQCERINPVAIIINDKFGLALSCRRYRKAVPETCRYDGRELRR